MTQPFSIYLPMDRRQALSRGTYFAEQGVGVALLADIAGFTPLTEALALAVSPRRGAEEVTALLNQAYGALIEAVDRFGGSVVTFSGDAISCWFGAHEGEYIEPDALFPPISIALRATACALAMQQAMHSSVATSLPSGDATLSLKVALSGGRVRRMLVGNPTIQRHEVLAGSLLDRLASVQHSARSGEVLLDTLIAQQLGTQLVATWRTGANGESLASVTGLRCVVAPLPWPALPAMVANEISKQWVLPAVATRLTHMPDQFLAELRPAVALMLEFHGLDYDVDNHATARLDSYICWVQQVIAGYGGALIDLTMGDRGSYLYAGWGAPETHDDDAARAVTAAHELLHPPSTMNWLVQLRIGLSRGVLWSGAYGSTTRRTYGVLGDATNLAFRLMSKAPPMAIWCDEAVTHAAKHRWAFAALPPVRVKGKANLIQVYQPLEAIKRRDAHAESPLVGRAAEQTQLADAIQAVMDGTSRILVLEGEAGIGKSRLVAEFMRLLRECGLTALLGAGHSIERHTAYRAWRDILVSFFGLDSANNLATQRARVVAALHLQPDLAIWLPLLNDILHLDVPETPQTRILDPAQRSEALDKLLIELLSTLVPEQPRIIVVEDVQWLDSRSWEAVTKATRALLGAQQPLLLLVTTRPLSAGTPEHAALATLLDLENATYLRLAALSADAIQTLATARLGLAPNELASEVVSLIQTRSGGNPFFAEELTDMLRQRGLIRYANAGTSDESRSIADSAFLQDAQFLPDTLQGLLLARIDQLPLEEQLTLKVAAVIGTIFAYSPLYYTRARDSFTNDAVLRQHLKMLVAQDFTALTAREPDLSYRFKHILAQEAAYQTLLYAQRRRLHRTVAEWYEHTMLPSTATENTTTSLANRRSPLLPLLAYHYRHAEDAERERHYAWLAGIQAADQYANSEALAYFTRALALTPHSDMAGRFDLMHERLNIHNRQEQLTAVGDELNLMEPLAEVLDDDVRRAHCATRRAFYAARTNDYSGAIVSAQQAIALAQSVNQPTIAIDAHRAWVTALGRQGNLAAARAQNEKLLHLIREQGDRMSETRVLNSIACNLMDLDDYASAHDFLQACLSLSQEIGDAPYERIALRNLGMIALDMREYSIAHDYFLKSLQVARTIGVSSAERTTARDLGQLAHEQGDYATALVAFEESLEQIKRVSDPVLECEVYSELARLFWKQGDLSVAHTHARHALGVAKAIGNSLLEAEVLTELGHIELALGQLTEARHAYQTARKMRRAMNQPNRILEPEAGLARLALAVGDLDGALAHADIMLAALAIGSLYGTTEPFLIDLTCYRVLSAVGDPRARAVLEQAYKRLQHASSFIQDQRGRHVFLEDVPINRELLLAWRSLQA